MADEPLKKITKDTTEVEGLRIGLEAICSLPSVDRLGALAKNERCMGFLGFLAARMAWMADANLAETAFPKKETVDQINSHVEKALREIYDAWAITYPHEVGPPASVKPAERPPFMG
jgi:hypothetical protein